MKTGRDGTMKEECREILHYVKKAIAQELRGGPGHSSGCSPDRGLSPFTARRAPGGDVRSGAKGEPSASSPSYACGVGSAQLISGHVPARVQHLAHLP